jgi:hypothetical protein
MKKIFLLATLVLVFNAVKPGIPKNLTAVPSFRLSCFEATRVDPTQNTIVGEMLNPNRPSTPITSGVSRGGQAQYCTVYIPGMITDPVV